MGKINKANVKKTIYYLKRNGIRNTWYAAKERMEDAKKQAYRYDAPTEEELQTQRLTNPGFNGKISIVVPTYHTPPQYLCEMIDSVLAQTYSRWELILADASEDNSVRTIVGSYTDERIRYVKLEENAGIAQNTNCALEYVTGEYIGLLDHDDLLTPDALYEMAIEIGKGAKFLYSDEDKCDENKTEYFDVNFKENFNLNLLLSNNYICHFMMMESSLMKNLAFRPEYDGAQDYDLVLRAAGELAGQEECIAHIPKVLYHWRCHGGSTAENPQSKQYAYEAGLRALQDFADRQGWQAKAEHLKHLGFYRLRFQGDIFTDRQKLGAVGGSVQVKGRIQGGRMTLEGQVLYKGLPVSYSGYMHRAVLTQDAQALDVRCIRVRKECVPIFEKITGVTYVEDSRTSLFDAKSLPKDTDWKALGLALGNALREAGYQLMYDPEITVRWK